VAIAGRCFPYGDNVAPAGYVIAVILDPGWLRLERSDSRVLADRICRSLNDRRHDALAALAGADGGGREGRLAGGRAEAAPLTHVPAGYFVISGVAYCGFKPPSVSAAQQSRLGWETNESRKNRDKWRRGGRRSAEARDEQQAQARS
jgi:hypothetical protein